MKIATRTSCINPKKPCLMAGYAMRKNCFKKIHDDLEVVSLWISNEDDEYLFVAMDVIGVDEKFCHDVRNRIVQGIVIKKENIIISGLHTHAGPLLYQKEHTVEEPDEVYRQRVQDIIVQDAIASYHKQIEVNPSITIMEIDGIYGNRNGKEKYGDKSVYLLEFYQDNALVGALCNISCHATVLGPDNEEISADLTGNLRRALHTKLNTQVILTNGNAGDMSNRQYRQGNDFMELDRVVDELSNQIIEKRSPQCLNMNHVTHTSLSFPIQYEMNHEALHRKIMEYEEQLKIASEYDQIKLLKSGIAAMNRKLGYQKVDFTIDCEILEFDEFIIATIPGELVSKFGREIKQSCKKPCMIWGYANGTIGYIVEQEEYGKAHESISSLIPQGTPEEFIKTLISSVSKGG